MLYLLLEELDLIFYKGFIPILILILPALQHFIYQTINLISRLPRLNFIYDFPFYVMLPFPSWIHIGQSNNEFPDLVFKLSYEHRQDYL